VTDKRKTLEINEYAISVKNDTIVKEKVKTKFLFFYNSDGFPIALWEFLHYSEPRIKNAITYDKKTAPSPSLLTTKTPSFRIKSYPLSMPVGKKSRRAF
jgi:hypothetical protein